MIYKTIKIPIKFKRILSTLGDNEPFSKLTYRDEKGEFTNNLRLIGNLNGEEYTYIIKYDQ